jgi:hypothetical protein
MTSQSLWVEHVCSFRVPQVSPDNPHGHRRRPTLVQRPRDAHTVCLRMATKSYARLAIRTPKTLKTAFVVLTITPHASFDTPHRLPRRAESTTNPGVSKHYLDLRPAGQHSEWTTLATQRPRRCHLTMVMLVSTLNYFDGNATTMRSPRRGR